VIGGITPFKKAIPEFPVIASLNAFKPAIVCVPVVTYPSNVALAACELITPVVLL
jgi:hypothetical protein